MTNNFNSAGRKNLYFAAIFWTIWCYFNIFILPDLLDLIPANTLDEVAPQFTIFIAFGGAALLYGPYVGGTYAYYELGNTLHDPTSFQKTLINLSPLVLSYILVILIIWYPTMEHLIQAVEYNLQKPNWYMFGIWAFVMYFVIKGTAKKPFDNVLISLLTVPIIHHLLKLGTWYRMDDGCRTDMDGFTECDDSYVQKMDRHIEEASSVNIPAEALIAAELYILILYRYFIYIVGGFIKIKIIGAEKYS